MYFKFTVIARVPHGSRTNRRYFSSDERYDNRSDEKEILKIEQPSRRRETTYGSSGYAGRRYKSQFCRNCRFEVHPEGTTCPTYGKRCNICSKYNHFAAVCRSGTNQQTMNRQLDRRPQHQRRHQIKRMEETEQDSENSSDEEFLTKSIAHMQIKMIKRKYGLEKIVPLMGNDIHIRAEPDTGADVNVMDEYQHRALQHRSEYDMTLRDSQTKLRTLQNELPVKGQFDAVLRNQTCGKRTTFIVIKGRKNSPPLINKNTLIQLGMLQIKEDGSFGSQNDMCIPGNICMVETLGTARQAIEAIAQNFNSVYTNVPEPTR